MALDVENDGRHEIVVADESGQLVALSADGQELWHYVLDGIGVLRGLDEMQLPSGDIIVTGLESGEVVVLDG